MKAAILADSGRRVGLGHLGRCLALAQALRNRKGITPVFLTADSDSGDWVQRKGFPARRPGGGKWDLLIADSYRLTFRELTQLRSAAGKLLLVDDLGILTGPCDWILNGSLYAHRIPYARARAQGLLLGPKFHPLRREFWAARGPRRIREQVRELLIILGGGDGWGLLEPLLALARAALPSARLNLVVGPLGSVPPLPRARSILLHRSPRSVRPILEACDLAIAAGGQTLYELAFAGTPTIALTLVNNQVENVRGFEHAGFLLSGGRPGQAGWRARLERLLRRAGEDHSLRERMCEAGQGLVDGLGGLRVADAILR